MKGRSIAKIVLAFCTIGMIVAAIMAFVNGDQIIGYFFVAGIALYFSILISI